MTPREQLYYNNWLELTDDIRDEAREEGRQEGRMAGIAEGEKRGFTRGTHDARLETARRMLADGMNIEQITKYAELPQEEILSLAKQ